MLVYLLTVFFFFNDTATTEIYTLSLHDALPICDGAPGSKRVCSRGPRCRCDAGAAAGRAARAGHRRRGRPARGAAAVPVAGGLSRGGGFPRGDDGRRRADPARDRRAAEGTPRSRRGLAARLRRRRPRASGRLEDSPHTMGGDRPPLIPRP